MTLVLSTNSELTGVHAPRVARAEQLYSQAQYRLKEFQDKYPQGLTSFLAISSEVVEAVFSGDFLECHTVGLDIRVVYLAQLIELYATADSARESVVKAKLLLRNFEYTFWSKVHKHIEQLPLLLQQLRVYSKPDWSEVEAFAPICLRIVEVVHTINKHLSSSIKLIESAEKPLRCTHELLTYSIKDIY
jgi:hypothetical protein